MALISGYAVLHLSNGKGLTDSLMINEANLTEAQEIVTAISSTGIVGVKSMTIGDKETAITLPTAPVTVYPLRNVQFKMSNANGQLVFFEQRVPCDPAVPECITNITNMAAAFKTKTLSFGAVQECEYSIK